MKMWSVLDNTRESQEVKSILVYLRCAVDSSEGKIGGGVQIINDMTLPLSAREFPLSFYKVPNGDMINMAAALTALCMKEEHFAVITALWLQCAKSSLIY
jgi:hypothetical protein